MKTLLVSVSTPLDLSNTTHAGFIQCALEQESELKIGSGVRLRTGRT